MDKFVEINEKVAISKQLEEDTGLVILMNKFNVNPEDVDKFLKVWTDHSVSLNQQPGFISTRLHRGIGGSGIFVNHAVWESTAQYKKALGNIDIQALVSDYPPNAGYLLTSSRK